MEILISNTAYSISEYLYRSHYCEEVGLEHVGQEVRLAGWLHAIRSLPTSLVFFFLFRIQDHFYCGRVHFRKSANSFLIFSLRIANKLKKYFYPTVLHITF
jgi:aspartyl-tRNA synthetase